MSTQRIIVGPEPKDLVEELSLTVGTTYEVENVSENMIYMEEKEDTEDPPTGLELGKRITSRFEKETAGADITVQANRKIWVWALFNSLVLVDD